MILFKYVLQQFLRLVGGTLFLCLFLFILFDFIHKMSGFFSVYKPASIDIALFYIYQLPFQIVQVLPIATLLSSVVVMVILGRNGEMMAMRAAGMTPFQIAAPIAAGGIFLSIVSYGLNELVLPHSAALMHYTAKVRMEKKNDRLVDENLQWVKSQNEIFHFSDYDPVTQVLSGIKLITIGANFRPSSALHANYAHYRQQDKIWEVKEISRSLIDDSGNIEFISHLPDADISLPVEPGKLIFDRRSPDELSLQELDTRISRGKSLGTAVTKDSIAWHVKLAYPLVVFIICFVGIPFGYRSERGTETLKSVFLAFVIGISYWFILNAARSLGVGGDLPPLLAGWIANIILTAMVSYPFYRVFKI